MNNEMEKLYLPIYSENKQIINERKKVFYDEVMKLYNNPKPLTKEEYIQIKQNFENGDKTALNKLFQRSMAHIIDIVATIYAKYDLENVLSFEQCVSIAFFKLQNEISYFNTLPNNWKTYIHSTINYLSFRNLYLAFKKEYYIQTKNDFMSTPELAWESDKRQSEELKPEELFTEDVKKRFEKIFSRLSSREVIILKLRYGLDGQGERTYDEIAPVVGLTRSRVQQIHKSVLRKIREPKMLKHLQGYEDTLVF